MADNQLQDEDIKITVPNSVFNFKLTFCYKLIDSSFLLERNKSVFSKQWGSCYSGYRRPISVKQVMTVRHPRRPILDIGLRWAPNKWWGQCLVQSVVSVVSWNSNFQPITGSVLLPLLPDTNQRLEHFYAAGWMIQWWRSTYVPFSRHSLLTVHSVIFKC